MRTLIIAEAGVNHNGDLKMAKKLITEAKKAGADIVKFQSFKANELVTKVAAKADYQKRYTSENESQFQMLQKLELSDSDHRELYLECKKQGIEFLSTPFGNQSFDILRDLGIQRVKLSSGDLTNLPFIEYVAQHKLPIILSTGMANIGEIEAALEVIQKAGTPKKLITVLHCSTEYPTPMHEVNLRAMENIKKTFSVNIGYSDHTEGIEIPIASVALGATIIEKHFTLDRNLAGPDHKASLEPNKLSEMIKAIRRIELALGDGIKRPTTSEIKNIAIARKSIVAIKNIKKGDKFSSKNIGVKRPGTGISPHRWNEILGRAARQDFKIDDLIEI
mgnify:CR=1 FL=1|tara:strand:- start:357 stop:1358 length:1002 start_codon:yes stop_codon:yes gene_type:complete